MFAPAVQVTVAPPVVVPAVQSVLGVGNQWEYHYERFRKHHPPKFDGGTDPTQVEQWMSMITTILDFMKVQGPERVACATYMFRKDVRIWWEVVTQTRDVATLTWEEFQSLFNRKYYNEAVRAAKADEFTRLT